MPPTSYSFSRRTFLAGLTLLPLATACGTREPQTEVGLVTTGNQSGPQVVVYKSPT